MESVKDEFAGAAVLLAHPDDALPLDDTVVTDDTVGLDLSWGSRPNDAAPAGIRPDDGS